MEYKIFIKGKFLPAKKAKISIQDTGFLFGYGLFETMRSYEGFVYKLEEHIKRLSFSADFLKIPLPFPGATISETIQKALSINNLYDAYIKLILSGGIYTGKISQAPSEPNFIIQTLPFVPYPDNWYKEGIKASIASIKKSSSSFIYTHKTLNFLENIIAKREAEEKGYQEAIFLNTEGFLTEGSTSNIFIVKKGKVITPSLSSGILPGVTRSVILALCNQQSIPFEEKKVKPEELLKADEAFLTNSLREVIPLARVNSCTIGKGEVGDITKVLMKEYKKDIHSSKAKTNLLKFPQDAEH